MDVKIKPIREEDLEIAMEWRMYPDITKYMNTDPQLTMEDQMRWYESIKNREDRTEWVIWLEDKPIGLISIFDIDQVNSRCSWGYCIADKKARSLKLAMYIEWSLYDYVFDVLKLHKLCNETFVDNKEVVKLHIMCGSTEDGIMRKHICKNGVYYDISIGSILAEEWFEKRKSIKYESFKFLSEEMK